MIEQVNPFSYSLREGNIIYFSVKRHIRERRLRAPDANVVYPGGSAPGNFPTIIKICIIPADYRAGTVSILPPASDLSHTLYRVTYVISKVSLIVL